MINKNVLHPLPLQMNPQIPSAPAYSQIPQQENSVQAAPYSTPVPPYPNEPPPNYEPPKGYYAPFPNQPRAQGPYQPPIYPGGSTSYQHGPNITPQPVIVVQEMGFGPESKEMVCPYCQAYVRTATEYQTGALTWLVSGLLCLFGCWSGCCLIPFCIGDMQDVIHHCPNCNQVVGTYQRLS
ncbi:lipopolysaccharide-induced tumor necrosis factor-alpha factor homolog isoform X1 [Octopus bimaculoides]|nr:lipopolysaccharide-induced tumor necrosis factor-alpha factor homolog isoform X1 [Octopus bimaculoides]